MFLVACVPYFIDFQIAEGVRLNLHRLVLVATLVLLIGSWIIRNNPGSPVRVMERTRGGGRMILAVACAHFLCLVMSGVASGEGLPIFLAVNAIATNLGVLLVAIEVCRREPSMAGYYQVLLASVAVVAMIVAVEAVLGHSVFRDFVQEDRNNTLNSGGLLREGATRFKGPFDHALTLAQYVVVVFPIILFSAPVRLSGLIIKVIIGSVLGGLVALTRSRYGAMIYLLQIVASVMIPVQNATRRLIFKRGSALSILGIVAVMVPVAILASGDLGIDEYFGRDLFDANVRDVQFANGMLALQDRPWLGYGLGDNAREAIYAKALSGDGEFMWERNAGSIDNYYLSVAVGSGIPSVFLFILMHLSLLAVATWRLPRIWRNSIAEGGRNHLVFVGYLLSYLSGIISMTVLSIFSIHSLIYTSMGVVFYFCFVSPLGALRSAGSRRDRLRQTFDDINSASNRSAA